MDQFEDFEEVFAFDPLFAYGEQKISKTLKCRRWMENELCIDRLLKTLEVEHGQYHDFPCSLACTDALVREQLSTFTLQDPTKTSATSTYRSSKAPH